MNLFKALGNYIRLRWRFSRWTRKDIESYQVRMIAELLRDLKCTSPFYRDMLMETSDLNDLPVIEKQEFMANFNNINTVGLDRDDLLEFAIRVEQENSQELYRGEYSIGLSSGTSGNKTLTVLGSGERLKYGVALAARNGISGIFIRRILFALRRFNPAYASVERYGVKLHFVDYTCSVDEVIAKINSQRVNILAGPPSLLTLLSYRLADITTKIKYVISYAEVLSPDESFLIQKAFGVPVLQIYQGAEGFVASCCKHGSLHINEDMVYCEFQAIDPSEPSIVNVVLTDLHRRTLPFVRYRLNDVLELDSNPCICGSSFKVIKQIHGRKDDIFRLLDKNGLEVLLFPDYVRRSINQASSDIREYQAIQRSYELIEVRLVLEPNAKVDTVRSGVVANLQRYMHKIGATIPNIEFSTAVPERNPRSQKLIRVVSLL